ncbi:hypothetical protein GMMP13_420073 [Candidatus Magnetomoraceae bacterium gMMP-13]
MNRWKSIFIIFIILSVIGCSKNLMRFSNKLTWDSLYEKPDALKNRIVLVVNEPTTIQDLPEKIGKGQKIVMEKISNKKFNIKAESILRVDYRNDFSYIDLLYPEIIILKPNLCIPMKCESKHDVAIASSDMPVSKDTPFHLSNYTGTVLCSGSEGAELRRLLHSKKTKQIVLEKGDAVIGKVNIFEGNNQKKKPNLGVAKLYGARSKNGYFSFIATLSKEDMISIYYLTNPKELQNNKPIIVEELPDDIGINKQITLRMEENHVIALEPNSLLRIDYIYGDDHFDLLYPETIILKPNTWVPLQYKGDFFEKYHFIDAQITAKNIRLSFPTWYEDKVLVSGADGAELKRIPYTKQLVLIKGEASIGKIERKINPNLKKIILMGKIENFCNGVKLETLKVNIIVKFMKSKFAKDFFISEETVKNTIGSNVAVKNKDKGKSIYGFQASVDKNGYFYLIDYVERKLLSRKSKYELYSLSYIINANRLKSPMDSAKMGSLTLPIGYNFNIGNPYRGDKIYIFPCSFQNCNLFDENTKFDLSCSTAPKAIIEEYDQYFSSTLKDKKF